jgi:hypothetical protein
MIQLTPEFLKKNGKPEFVVLPYEEFLLLEEILADLQDLRQAKADEHHEPTVALADVKTMFNVA